MYEQQRKEASKAFKSEKPKGRQEVERVLDTQGQPYSHEVVKGPLHGIQPVNRECKYPVVIGDVESSECTEGQYESNTYAVKYPETEEQKRQKYYDEVLRRHEESCQRAAEYKETHECLPGTVQKEGEVKDLSKNILVSEVEEPSPDKLNPCKKKVHFAEPLDTCAQPIDDTCNLKVEKDHCDCTQYNP